MDVKALMGGLWVYWRTWGVLLWLVSGSGRIKRSTHVRSALVVLLAWVLSARCSGWLLRFGAGASPSSPTRKSVHPHHIPSAVALYLLLRPLSSGSRPSSRWRGTGKKSMETWLLKFHIERQKEQTTSAIQVAYLIECEEPPKREVQECSNERLLVSISPETCMHGRMLS